MKKKIIGILSFFFFFLKTEKNRQDWVKLKMGQITKGESLLDAGAGETQYKKYCDHLRYVSQDFGEYDGTGDGNGLQMREWDNSKLDIISDIIKIPVNNGSFDNILCTEVFEHIPYPEKAVSEFSRILKNKGKLFLTAPFCSMTHFAPFHFSTGFNKYWYEKILSDNGFEILSLEINGNYFDYICQELARIPFIIKKYSKFWYLGFILYLIIIPLILVLMLVSKVSRGSQSLMCFGYHIIAQKNNLSS